MGIELGPSPLYQLRGMSPSWRSISSRTAIAHESPRPREAMSMTVERVILGEAEVPGAKDARCSVNASGISTSKCCHGSESRTIMLTSQPEP